MKIAITGKPGAGAQTLFAAVAGLDPNDHKAPRIIAVKVPDPRVDALGEIWKPKKKVFIEAQFLDLSAETVAQGGADLLHQLAAADAIALVVNDCPVPGSDQKPNPAADLAAFADDLVLKDQLIVETRLERMAKANQKGLERDLLERVHAHFESGKAIRLMELTEPERTSLVGYGFVSARPILVVVNVDEARAAAAPEPKLVEQAKAIGGQVISLSAAVEAEIGQLDEADQKGFLEDLGLHEPARGRFLRAAHGLLDLITFLTMGEDECRSWSVRRGAKAPETGRRIHSDIERGFIRVEVIAFTDFMELKSEAACRKVGKLRVEGKEYVTQDGDILNFRFNV